MADIKKIKLPNGTEFDIKDETARSQMEVSANKVTSIDSASTDSQYPSAKAVYLAVQASAEHTHNFYWANVATTTTSTYNTTPELATLKLNGNTSATTASTSNVQLIFDPSTQVLNFVFT